MLENINILQEEKLVEKVADETGPYLKKRWQEFEDHPLVGEVRNVGLLGALELVEDKATRKHFPKDRKVGEVCRDICKYPRYRPYISGDRECVISNPQVVLQLTL